MNSNTLYIGYSLKYDIYIKHISDSVNYIICLTNNQGDDIFMLEGPTINETTRDERIMDDGEIYPNKKSVTISARPFIEKGYSNIIKSETEKKSKDFQEVAANLYDEMQNEHLQNLIYII